MDIIYANHGHCLGKICTLFLYHACYTSQEKSKENNHWKWKGTAWAFVRKYYKPQHNNFQCFCTIPKFGYFTTVGFVKAISHDHLYSDFFWSEKNIWGVTSPLLNPAFFSSFTQFWECNCFPRCTNAFFRLGSFGGVASGLASLLLSKWASH